MPNTKQKKSEAEKTKALTKKIKEIEKKINDKLTEFKTLRTNRACFPLLMGDLDINNSVVDDTFDELRNKYKDCDGKIDVIVDSGGGDIDSAYNLSNLFRKFAKEELNFIVPRWAKSAATLLVCSGDKIFMTPVAELGPLDPQITEFNPFEKRLEQFSPLHIEATLELIRKEFADGNEKLAKSLMERLQFPMTLGSFRKSLDIAEEYLIKLLSSRMIKDDMDKVKKIAKQLTTGYADHAFSINVGEAQRLGLNAIELDGDELNLVWVLHKLVRQKRSFKRKIDEEEMSEVLKKLPQEVLDRLPSSLKKPLRGNEK
jgi:ClpP class serine protease